MKNNKISRKEYWLIGNGLNIQFAGDRQKDWLKWIADLSEDTRKLNEFYQFVQKSFNDENNDDLYKINGDPFSKHLDFQKYLIFLNLFIKIYKKKKNNKKYYEEIMFNLLDNDLSEQNLLNKANLNWYEKNDIRHIFYMEKKWADFCYGYDFSTDISFILKDNKLILKYKFDDLNHYEKFYDMLIHRNLKEGYDSWDDEKQVWTLTIKNFKNIFKKYYLTCLNYWINSINDDYGNNRKKETSNSLLVKFFTKRSKFINNLVYTTNYFFINGFGGFKNSGLLAIYNEDNNFAVYPKEKKEIVTKKLNKIDEKPFDKKYDARELHIFGLDPRMDTDLIKKLINKHTISKIIYWIYENNKEIKKIVDTQIGAINKELDKVGRSVILEYKCAAEQIYKINKKHKNENKFVNEI